MGALALTPTGDNGSADRSTREVVEEHLHLRKTGEIEKDLARNFADDVVLLTPDRAQTGKNAVRETGRMLARAVSDPCTYSYDSLVCEGEVALLEWSVRTDEIVMRDGVDTFLVRDGLIRAQTIRYSLIR